MSKEEKRLLSEVSKGLVKPPSSVSETSFISDGEAPKSKKEIAEGRGSLLNAHFILSKFLKWVQAEHLLSKFPNVTISCVTEVITLDFHS